jgi:hypothetical protein
MNSIANIDERLGLLSLDMALRNPISEIEICFDFQNCILNINLLCKQSEILLTLNRLCLSHSRVIILVLRFAQIHCRIIPWTLFFYAL